MIGPPKHRVALVAGHLDKYERRSHEKSVFSHHEIPPFFPEQLMTRSGSWFRTKWKG